MISRLLYIMVLTAVGATAVAQEAPRPLVAEAAEDLAAVRRVTLKAVPPVEVVTRERYVEEYVIPVLDWTWGGDFDASLEIFKALGMVPQDLQAKPFLRKYGSAVTVAAYDFLKKRILFPGELATRDALVHELMHASQDERHDLKAFMSPVRGNFDETLARGALVEGEALNVQLRWQLGYPRALAGVTPYGTLRDEARAYFERVNAHAQACLPEAPPAVLAAQAFVYEEGVLFVEKLRRREHNWAAVDAAYANPPRSTAQILHPEKYLAGEWPVELTIANKVKLFPDGELVAENTLGEFGMRLFLISHGTGGKDAAKAVEGWRGDRVLLYHNKRLRTDSLTWISTWENPACAQAAGKAFQDAFARQPGPLGFADVNVAKNRVIIWGLKLVPLRFVPPQIQIADTPSAEGRPLGEQDEKAK